MTGRVGWRAPGWGRMQCRAKPGTGLSLLRKAHFPAARFRRRRARLYSRSNVDGRDPARRTLPAMKEPHHARQDPRPHAATRRRTRDARRRVFRIHLVGEPDRREADFARAVSQLPRLALRQRPDAHRAAGPVGRTRLRLPGDGPGPDGELRARRRGRATQRRPERDLAGVLRARGRRLGGAARQRVPLRAGRFLLAARRRAGNAERRFHRAPVLRERRATARLSRHARREPALRADAVPGRARQGGTGQGGVGTGRRAGATA